MAGGSFGSLGTATVDVKADFAALDSDLGKIPGKVAQMSTQVDASMSGVKGGFRNAGFAALEFSRAIEDLQYGLNGVINNIPGMVMALGGGAGLTAAISLGAVAVNQLVKHWGDLADALGMGATLTEAERMDKLAHATEKTAEATAKLLKYKERQATIEAQDTEKSDAEKAAAAAVRAAVKSPNRDKIITGIVQSARDTLVSSDPDARAAADALKKREDFHRNFAPEFGGRARTAEEFAAAKAADAKIPTLQSALNEALIAAAKKLVADAENSPDRLKALQGVVKGNPGAFPAGLAADLAGAKDADLRDKIAKAEDAESKELDDRLRHAEERKEKRDQAQDAELKEAVDRSVAAASREVFDPNDPFDKAQMENDLWLASGKPKRDAARKRKAELLDTDTFMAQLATAGISKGRDSVPSKIDETNKKLDALVKNTEGLHKLRTARYGKKA